MFSSFIFPEDLGSDDEVAAGDGKADSDYESPKKSKKAKKPIPEKKRSSKPKKKSAAGRKFSQTHGPSELFEQLPLQTS